MATSPDSVSYAETPHGLLGPLVPGWINAQDFGADPTGNDIASRWLQEAADAVPADGGVLLIPPGNYQIDRPLVVNSNVTITGWGATLTSCAAGSWVGANYFAITNRNNTASVLTDSNIKIIGLSFDYASLEVISPGGIHIVYMRKATNIRVLHCNFAWGDDHTAFLACNDTLVFGCHSTGASNCTYDHWDGAQNARVIGNYIETGLVASQAVNFNAQPTVPGARVADGFIMADNIIIGMEPADATPIQVEPLGTGSTAKNVIIANNKFYNIYLVCRGNCQNFVIEGNTFDAVSNGRQAIIVNSNSGDTPDTIVIRNNRIINPTTSSSLGVIQVTATNYEVSGNWITGSTYGAIAGINTSGSSGGGVVYGNTVSNGVLNLAAYHVGTLGLNVASDKSLGWYDNAGSRSRMFCQGSDNNFIFYGTDASGAARAIWSVVMRSNSSEFTHPIPVLYNSTRRSVPGVLAAAGTTIGTATSLTANINNVTTCTAGVADGVILIASTGREQTVINSTADTLKVYPNNSGSAQIDVGGASVPATIAAGKSKTFVQVAANDFRTTAAT